LVGRIALGQCFIVVIPFSSVSIIPPWLSTLIYRMGDERQARWWPQYTDMFSSDRHKQAVQLPTAKVSAKYWQH
jgi:hypothetical protein